MNILVNRAHDNLNILYNLNSGDTLNAKRGEIIISDKDDFVQVDNISDLEYSIYFTYHQLLTSNEIDDHLNTDLIEKLDLSIDKMFDNKQLNDQSMNIIDSFSNNDLNNLIKTRRLLNKILSVYEG